TDLESAELGENALDFLPRHRGSAWVDGRVADVSARLRVRTQSRVIDRGDTLPARGELDASVWSALGAGLSASLRVENLLDHRYDERSGVEAVGRVAFLSIDGTI